MPDTTVEEAKLWREFDTAAHPLRRHADVSQCEVAVRYRRRLRDLADDGKWTGKAVEEVRNCAARAGSIAVAIKNATEPNAPDISAAVFTAAVKSLEHYLLEIHTEGILCA